MPTINKNFTATSDDGLQGVNFADIGGNGAIVNMWAAGQTAADAISFKINNQDLITPNTLVNVGSAQVVKDNEDQLVFNEQVPPGHLYLPIEAVTAGIMVRIHIRYL